MQNRHRNCVTKAGERPLLRAAAVHLALALILLATGCTLSLSPLARHTAAFSTATAVIIDNSEDAYRAANQLRRDEQIAAAIDGYDKVPNWSPYTALQPLLTPDQLSARIKVLDALKAYAQQLADLTNSKKQNESLGEAAAAAGNGLRSLSAATTSDLQKVFPGLSAMTAPESDGVSTAIVALANLLINGKVKKALAKTTQDMDPNIEILCKLIDSDVKIIRRQADVDYQTLIGNNDQFIRHSQLDPALRRGEIAKLITLALQQQDNDALLARLQKAIVTLALTHHALAVAAQGNNPESIQQHIAELSSVGQDLGNYYKLISIRVTQSAK